MRREMFAMLLVGLLIVTTFLGCIGEKEGLKPPISNLFKAVGTVVSLEPAFLYFFLDIYLR
jgi:hypothetical protein